jgi:hypothetical protein
MISRREILKIGVTGFISQVIPSCKTWTRTNLESRLWAGVSEVVITPPVGAPVVDNKQRSTGIHDDLFVKALVLSDGEHKTAIICIDLEGVDVSWSDNIREMVKAKTGITTTLLNCSHTHSAPFLMPLSWNAFGGGKWFQDEGAQWYEELKTKVVNAVVRAAAGLTTANLHVGRTSVQIGSNRRLPTEKGIVMKPNPDGAVVPWVDVLRVDDISGKPIAILFSHVAHPVTIHGWDTLISADYPGYAVKEVERRLGGGVRAMFAQGCCGNINSDPLRGGHDAAKRAGEILGAAVVKAATESRTIEPAKIRTASVTANLSFQDIPNPEECKRAIIRAEERLAKAKDNKYIHDEIICLRDLLTKSERGEKQTLRFEIQMLAIGKMWCLLAMPHEVFAEYQLWIDKNSPFEHNMVLAYTGGCESYVPTDKDFSLGGYEAVHSPTRGAALGYPYRAALRPGIEHEIKKLIRTVWSR